MNIARVQSWSTPKSCQREKSQGGSNIYLIGLELMSPLTSPEPDGATSVLQLLIVIFCNEPDYVPPVQVSAVLTFA